MGFIDKSSLAVDAVLTKKGIDYLRRAVYGENQNGEHVITKFALSDDEIDYSLWESTPVGSNFERQNGKVIDNQPLTEPNINWRGPTDSEIMKNLLFKTIDTETTSENTQTTSPSETQPPSPPLPSNGHSGLPNQNDF
jgi:hypothetical protein